VWHSRPRLCQHARGRACHIGWPPSARVNSPKGAADCSRGWSTGRRMAGGAQPVGAFVFQHIRPVRGGGSAGMRGGSAPLRWFGHLLRPAGAKRGKGIYSPQIPLSTGCASGPRGTPPLHPRLQPAAPLGRKTAPLRSGTGRQGAAHGLNRVAPQRSDRATCRKSRQEQARSTLPRLYTA
jgi:hypothetical protein